jgi:hypothetical protein
MKNYSTNCWFLSIKQAKLLRKYSRFLVVVLVLFQSMAIYADETTGTMGGKSLRDNSYFPLESFQYTLELMPGQVFDGWWYYWTLGGPLTAQLQESPDVSWLSLSPTSFTSDTCTTIVGVTYSFVAPLTPGLYTTTIVDANGNWPDQVVTLFVTASPTSAFIEYVQLNSGQSYTSYDTLYFTPFEGFGCLQTYTPPTPSNVVYALFPQVSWLTITPSQMTIGPTDTIVVSETFTNSTPGSYSCYEIWTADYFSWPEFTQWNLTVLTDIEDNAVTGVPDKIDLAQNYPNPFNPFTTIHFKLPESGLVKLSVYDITGREIEVLMNEVKNTGEHTVNWNATNRASGIYYYQLEAGNVREMKKMILLK